MPVPLVSTPAAAAGDDATVTRARRHIEPGHAGRWSSGRRAAGSGPTLRNRLRPRAQRLPADRAGYADERAHCCQCPWRTCRLRAVSQLCGSGGSIVAEGDLIACQTWIEGTFTGPFTHSPVGKLEPNGAWVVWDLMNMFRFDDRGRLVEEIVRTDNRSFLRQLGAEADTKPPDIRKRSANASKADPVRFGTYSCVLLRYLDMGQQLTAGTRCRPPGEGRNTRDLWARRPAIRTRASLERHAISGQPATKTQLGG